MNHITFTSVALTILLAGPSIGADASAAEPRGQRPVVLLLGDSNMFGALGHVLTDAFRDAGFDVKRKAKPGSGLAYPRFYDWLKLAPNLADRYDADVVVIIFGGNDAQSLKPGDAQAAPLRIPWQAQDEWSREYARRVRKLATSITRRGRQLVVLSPTNRRPRKAVARMQRVLSIQEQVLSRIPGASWIDTWRLSSNRESRYLAVGPDKRGRRTKYRRGDGIHLTRAGAEALARRLLPRFANAIGAFPNRWALSEDRL